MGIVDPSGQDRDPSGPPDPYDDVHPLDLPPADQVAYDLGGWSHELQAEAAAALAAAGVPHAWDGDELVIHVRHEATADRVLDEVERIGIEQGAIVALGEVATNGDAPTEVEYGLDGWQHEARALVSERLAVAGIGFRWEDETTLVVAIADEQAADSIMDGVEVDLAGGPPDRSPLEVLFAAVDNLERRPGDRHALLELNEAFEAAETAPLPFGLDVTRWNEVLDDVSDLVDVALTADDGDDVRERAGEVRARLRPLV